MKKKILLISLFILLIAIVSVSFSVVIPQLEGIKDYNASKTAIETTDNGDTITIMSSNVRVFNPDDKYEKCWIFRAPYIKKNIEKANPDIISFQEVEKIHVGYLTKILSNYNYVLKYRDNSLLKEGCPIFYRKDKFLLLKEGYFWLSDTPDVMSKDKDAACYRICTYVILKDKNTDKEIVVFNTHLDHVSEDSRIRGITLVLNKIKEFGFENKAAVLMGDMNDFVGSKTIDTLFDMFDDGYARAIDKNGIAIKHPTYQGFGKKDQDRIDFFGISKEGITVNSYDCIDTIYSSDKYDTIYPSDHFPIVINITLN